MNSWSWIPCVIVSGVIASCGGTHPNTAFREIQTHEARIAEAWAACQRATPNAPLRAQTHERACQSSERICDLADELEDNDARTRCERSIATCQSLKACRSHTP